MTWDDPFTIATKHWHRLDDGRSSATCVRAPASCTKGSAGCASCAAGSTTGVKLTTYGRSSGFCVDPIEKKPLNHFLPGTAVLSFGTAGCNLACKFCQNWDISKSREIDTLASRAGPNDLARRRRIGLPQCRVYLQRPDDLHGVRDRCRQACRARGVSVAVTAGYMCPEPRAELFSTWTRPTST